jgi:TalC/MipB family fructose-6-phosphate aldolase
MRLYGAGSIEDIRNCTQLGVEGILTNPQGFEQYFKGAMTLPEITQAILDASEAPVFIQLHGESPEVLVARARELHALSARVGFKILADGRGFTAIRVLQQEGISCIATCLFSVAQAAVAASVGAFGICPFVSRAREIGMDAAEIIRTIRTGYDRRESAPAIIAVSLKGVADVELALAAGADAVGMRYPLIAQMMSHPLTTRAEELFARNWANVKGEEVGYLRGFMNSEGVAE